MPTREFRFRFTSLPGDADHEADAIEGLCEGFVRCNLVQIEGDPGYFPNLLDGLRYIPPPSCVSPRGVEGCQPVKGAVPLVQSGMGTCIDLACLLVAQMRYQGDYEAYVAIEPEIPGQQDLYHAVAIDGQGNVWDPQEIAQRKGVA